MDEEPRQVGESDAWLAYQQSVLPQAFLDLEGRFASANAELERLMGVDEAWLLGRRVNEILHPLDERGVRGEEEQLRLGPDGTVSVEVLARHADGHPLQLLVDGSLVTDSDGKPRCISLLAHDVTAVRSAEERLAGQERLYRALSHRSADAALVMDAAMVVTFCSPVIVEMLGLDVVDVLGSRAIDLVHHEDRAALESLVEQVATEPDSSQRALARLRRSDGAWRWCETTVVNSLADADVGGLILSLRDVTVEHEAERAVRESEARYRAVVDTAHEGIVAIDASGRVELANEMIGEILGMSAEQVDDSDWSRSPLLQVVDHDREPGATRGQVRWLRPDGGERVLSVAASPLPVGELGGDEHGTLVMISDVTEAHQLQERLRHQALHDRLTGLPNRYLFEDRLEMAAARQGRQPEGSTAVMFLDLDGFKQVNDTLGHAAGDDLLAQVGRGLVDAVRASDTVARLGGDEFAIVCEGLDEQAARTIAARIREDVFGSLAHAGLPASVGASIGIAMFPPNDPAKALSLADTAMYQAKRIPGGGVIVFGADTCEPPGA